MTEFELLIDLHKGNDRQGPGSPADTLRALDLIALPQDWELRVADIGCGSGGQSLTLARQLHATITAVDLFGDFLTELKRRAVAEGLGDQIETLEASMDALPFDKQSLDLIWSEGAVYSIGFAKGVRLWKEFLKPGGYLALSEVTWISQDRPQEIEDFWQSEYPEIDTAANKIKVLEENGLSLTGYFILSPESWIRHYYEPLEASFPAFLERNAHSEAARQVVEAHREEIALYRANQDFYSYGFYIAKKA